MTSTCSIGLFVSRSIIYWAASCAGSRSAPTRGLAAPVLRPLLKGAFGAELAHGCAVMLGRLDGLLDWGRRQP